MRRTPRRFSSPRSGVVLVLVVVLLLISVMIAGAIIHSLVMDARQLDWNRQALQADRLAESGLRRARARLAADPSFSGEMWSPALPGGPGEVVITVTFDNQTRILKSRATFPADSGTPVRATRILRLPIPGDHELINENI